MGPIAGDEAGVAFGNSSIYGYTIRRGELIVEPEQAEVVRRVYHEFLTERKGTHTIARELTEAGIPPPLRPSGPWSASTVLKILKNEKYCGDLLQRKYRTTDYLSHRKILNDGTEEQILLRDHHEPVISREQFDSVQEELAKRAGMAGDKGRFSSRYWFSGKIRCGCCGRTFTVKRTKRAGGREYQRFVCRGRYDMPVKCPMRAVRGEVILLCARRVLEELALDRGRIVSETLKELYDLRRTQAEDAGSVQKAQSALQRQLDRRDRALEAYLDGDLTRSDMQRLTARCEQEILRLRERLAEAERRRTAPAWDGDSSGAVRALLERELAGGESVLDEVIRRITVHEDCFVIEVAELPVRFRVRARVSGTGDGFRVTVTECIPETDAAETPGSGYR